MIAFLAGLAFAQEPPPKFDGEVRTLELDASGGTAGAPDGMVFILPAGAGAELTAGDLGEGVTGFRIVASAPSDAVVCTAAIPMGGSVFVKSRVRVLDITPGASDWQGATVEVRSRGEGGALISPMGAMFNEVKVLRSKAPWADVQAKVLLPPGTAKGEVCFRLAVSTGTMEVDRLMVIAPRGKGGSAKSAANATSAPVVIRVASPDSPPPASAPSAPGGRGLAFDAPAVTSQVACSQWLPASKAITVFGELTVSQQDAAAPDWSGVAVEAYAVGAGGPWIGASGAPYMPLRTRTVTGTETFSETWRAPAGAQQVKFCARYSAAAGSVRVDWRGGR